MSIGEPGLEDEVSGVVPRRERKHGVRHSEKQEQLVQRDRGFLLSNPVASPEAESKMVWWEWRL